MQIRRSLIAAPARLWQVRYGLSALIGLLCLWLGFRASELNYVRPAIALSGAGIIFALLGTGLRDWE